MIIYILQRFIKQLVEHPPVCLYGLYTNIFDDGLITYDLNKFRENRANVDCAKQ